MMKGMMEGGMPMGEMPMDGEGGQKTLRSDVRYKCILAILVCMSTHHQYIAYNSWSFIKKFWMFFSQVMKEHSHSSKEVFWLTNIHPET